MNIDKTYIAVAAAVERVNVAYLETNHNYRF